jgi:photosystem II stability/assembly factor-like uncharacterized protein
VSGTGPQNAVAVGDAGTVLVFDGTWKPVETGVTSNLHAVARLGSALWIVGDAGTVLTMDPTGRTPTVPGITPVAKIDLGTTCDLLSVFVRGPEVWIIGGRGGVSGVWTLRDGKIAERWGEC